MPTSGLAEQTLYHTVPVNPKGNSIEASLGYGTKIPQNVKDALGIRGDKKVGLVFAATHISKALAFGFSYSDREILFNAMINENENSELVIVCNRDATMSRTRAITIFSFCGEGFVQLPNAERQCVSQHPVPFRKTTKIIEAHCAEDLMRAGLQILSFEEPFESVRDYGVVKAMRSGTDLTLSESLDELVRDGRVVWENQKRAINANSALSRYFSANVHPVRPPSDSLTTIAPVL